MGTEGVGVGSIGQWLRLQLGKLYTGKEDDRVALGLGESVVLAMAECLPAGHVVYCDNFFTRVLWLALTQERRGIGSCGTVRANRRGLLVQLKKFATAKRATMQLTSPLFLRSSKMLAVGWFDKCPVCLLTNIYSTATVTKQRRGHPDFEKPVAIECYTQNMGGVDSADQCNSYYALTKRSYKWWKKVFMHLLVTAVSNAYILHRSSVWREATQLWLPASVGRTAHWGLRASECDAW